jgi:hypothetical protein
MASSPAWVFGNLWHRWAGIARRHSAKSLSLPQTLVLQLSGYGATHNVCVRTVQSMLDQDKVRYTKVYVQYVLLMFSFEENPWTCVSGRRMMYTHLSGFSSMSDFPLSTF